MEKKNVLLIDIRANYVESLLELDNVNLEMLVIDNQYLENDCKNKYRDKIKNYYRRVVYLNDEFEQMHKTDYNLTYEEIEAFRSTQLKCEHNLHREILDDGTIQYRYLSALRYWISFFKNRKIDYIFLAMDEHGGIWDSLPLDIAKYFKIPAYVFSFSSTSSKKEVLCLKRLNDNKLIDINKLKLAKPDFEKFFATLQNYKEADENKIITWKDPIKHYKEILKNLPEYIKEKYFVSPIKKYKRQKSYFKHMHYLTTEEFIDSTIYVHNLKKVYNKISTKPDYTEKFIYYPLHQEPESSIMARITMTSQLFAIKMISENLPEGWKLYVKEHPAEFYIYENCNFFLRNISYYRTNDFYRQINDFKNVKLIDINENANKLIHFGQAVASICGTTLLQGMIKQKPILIFGNQVTLVEKLKDACSVNNTTDIKNFFSKLEKGFLPDYSDLKSVVEKYVFEKSGYEVDFFHKKEEDVVKIFEFLTSRERERE